ncbi:hypothetical protein M1N60_01995, partial [Thermodesulfovibrionales bacterium]|nr:hypothetical protein [Thermodesulfovibrionales bacterium]
TTIRWFFPPVFCMHLKVKQSGGIATPFGLAMTFSFSFVTGGHVGFFLLISLPPFGIKFTIMLQKSSPWIMIIPIY